MRIGKRRSRTPLSVCCVTDQSAAQTAAALAALRPLAAEIVIGLDSTRAADRTAFERIADRVVVVDAGPLEHNIATVHDACRHDWVFRIDADEFASAELVRDLPGLIAREDVRQYAFARRWLTADGGGWTDGRPWWPDWQVRLVRRSTAVFPQEIHVPVELDEPRLFIDAPLYHASAALLTPEQRQRKMLRYEVVLRGGPGTLREPTAVICEPERFSTLPCVDVPIEDRLAVATFLETARRGGPGGVPPVGPAVAGTVAAPIEGIVVAGEVGIELLERDLRWSVDGPRTVTLRLTNRSDEPWGSGAQPGDPGEYVSYRWVRDDGAVEEGARTPFPVTVPPGDSVVLPVLVVGARDPGPTTLELAVVSEHVRWLTGSLGVGLTVAPPSTPPTAREVRPEPAGPPIPRILHRVWLGDAPLPDEAVAFGETWALHHPDWDLRLWTDDDAPHAPGLERARNLAERADLVRCEILRRHGGVYVDTDVECLRPIDDLLDGVAAFAGYEVPGRLCNAVMGGVPGHPAFTRLGELAEIVVGHGHYPESTATTFVTYVLESFPDVTLFAAHRFYPDLWDGRLNEGDDAPYARHHWAQTWVQQPSQAAPAPLHPGA